MGFTNKGMVKSTTPMPRSSLALDNLRAFVILLVLSFHSVLAYLQFLPVEPFSFDSPPYLCRAFPITAVGSGSRAVDGLDGPQMASPGGDRTLQRASSGYEDGSEDRW
jgi:hypothetical protein